MSVNKISELFLNNIDALPLWVKQVVYRKTEKVLKKELADFMTLLNPHELLQEITPSLTLKGRQELEEHNNTKLSGIYYVFLSNVNGENDLFEIALNNFWTLIDISKMLITCSELEYISGVVQDKNYAIAEFLAGRIRTGELLKRMGKINTIQLEQALREQKERKAEGISVKMAAVMISLGFIKDEDIKILLAFKEEASKRFIMGLGLTTLRFDEENENHKKYIINLQREFKRLDHENRILKSRLRKVLNIKE